MRTEIFCFYLQNRQFKPVKQEVNGTVILPPLVFPLVIYDRTVIILAMAR
jgi:hypothetical protein